MTQFKAKKTSILAASLIVAAFASNILIHESAAAAVPTSTCMYDPSDPKYNNAEMERCIALGEYRILDGDAREKWKEFYDDVNHNGGSARNTQIAGATSIANLTACNENTEYIYRVGQLFVWNGDSLENGLMGDDHNNPTFGLRGTASDNISWLNNNPVASSNVLGKVDSQFYKRQTLYFKSTTSPSLVPIAQLTKLIAPTSNEARTLLTFGSRVQQPSHPTLFCATPIMRQVRLSDDVELSFTKPPANTVEPLSVGSNNAGQRVYEIEESSVRVNISIAPLDYVEDANYEYSKEIVDLLRGKATVKVGGVTRSGTWKYEDGLAKFQTTIQLTGEGDTAIEVHYPRNIIANGSSYVYSDYADKTIVITLLGTNSCSKWAFDNPDISNTGSFNAAASATANSFGNTHSIRSNSTEPNNTLYVSPKDKSYYRLFYCLGQFASNNVSITNKNSIFFRSNINPYPFEDNLTTPLNLAKGKGQSVLNPKKDTAALSHNKTYTQAVRPNGTSGWYRADIVMPYNYVMLPTVSISTGSGKAMAGGKVKISANIKAFSRINNAVNDHYAYKTDTRSASVDVRYFETLSLPGASISNPARIGRSATSGSRLIGGDSNGVATVDANDVPISSDSVGKYFCAIAIVSNADSHDSVPAFMESASIPSEVGKNSKLKLSDFGPAWTVDGNSVGTGATIASAPACVKIYGSSKIAVENSSLFVSGAIQTAATNDDNLKSKVSNTIVANGTFAETSNLPSMLAGGSVLGGNTHTVDQQILLNSRCLTNNAFCKTGSAQGKADEIARTVNALKARYTAHSTAITVLNQNFINSISCVQNASGVWIPSATNNTYLSQFECSNDGVILINARSSGLTIQGTPGRNITVNKDIIVTTNGKVSIESNIELQNASAANAAKIVNFAIVAGTITVHSDVTYVDAWLIANSLDTCETEPNSAGECNRPVTFKGPVSAGSINLYRTTVTSAGNAEVFSPDADDYYWAYEKSSVSDVLKATYVKEYSPRY